MPFEQTSGITRIDTVDKLSSGETTQFICGYLHCDQRFNPLLGALPDLIVASRSAESGGPRDFDDTDEIAPANRVWAISGDWLAATLDHMIEEALSERRDSAEMLARLSEILFVELVRRYMDRLPAAEHGWLAGIRDPVVGQALRLMHAQPERAWTVAGLADAVAISRSALAKRFTTLIGETPMGYLAGWRMHLAMQLLKQTRLPLTAIADRVGYGSEVAFNRAFKRHIGLPPATWRITAEKQSPAS
jgi:transcriptional regulator GlxA family with amidase domain